MFSVRLWRGLESLILLGRLSRFDSLDDARPVSVLDTGFGAQSYVDLFDSRENGSVLWIHRQRVATREGFQGADRFESTCHFLELEFSLFNLPIERFG